MNAVPDVELLGDTGQQESYQTLLTPTAIQFVAELIATFESRVDQVSVWHKHTTTDPRGATLIHLFVLSSSIKQAIEIHP